MPNFKKFINIEQNPDGSTTVRYCLDGAKIVEYITQTSINDMVIDTPEYLDIDLIDKMVDL